MSVTVFDMTGGMSQKVFELTRNKHTLSDLSNNYFPESPAQVGSIRIVKCIRGVVEK